MDGIHRVFERFYRGGGQLHKTPAARDSGLPLQRPWSSYTEGRIWVEITPTQGSQFYGTFPTERPSD